MLNNNNNNNTTTTTTTTTTNNNNNNNNNNGCGQQSNQRRRKDSQVRPIKLKQQYPGYEVKQFSNIIDVLGGWSVDVEETMKDLVGQRSRSVLRRIQKVILSHSLNTARAFKVLM